MRVFKLAAGSAVAISISCGFAAAPALAQGKEPLKIGVPTALSGPYAVLADHVKKSVEFAIAQANEKGGVDGRKIEYKMLDTEVKPDVARKQAEKLALEGYNILIGTISSGEGLAMAPMLERWDAVFVSTFSKNTKLIGDTCSPRLFRANQGDQIDFAVIKPWLDTRKEKKWALLNADIAWGREVGKNVREAAGPDKQIVSENYAPFGANDYAPFIQQVKTSGAEAVFVAMSGRDAINFLQQAKQFGLSDNVLISGVSINLDSVTKAVGAGAAKGVWGVVNYSASIDTPQNKEFVAAWKKMYNEEPADLDGENYVGMQLILQAVEKAKSVKPADVAKAMHGGTFDTVFGKVLVRAEDHQMVLPNYFGLMEVGDGGKLVNTIKFTLPADKATPPADGSCKMGKL